MTTAKFTGSLKTPENVIVRANFLNNTTVKIDFSIYGRKALIVTGPHVGKSTVIDHLKSALHACGVECELFAGITGEPTDVMISAGVEAYRNGGCDFCIGVGGGSPLDSAKAIAAMTVLPGAIADYVGREITGDIPAVVAIPTTAGTGSEATKFTIITDVKSDVKMLLKGDVLLPRLAIVDYTLSLSAPQSVTAATGLDALTHAIEAYVSVKASPDTDKLAIDAVMRIMQYLPIAYRDGSNHEAREQMAIAALEAGVCINNSGVTVVHGMSRPIGALFHVPHGISNAMLLCTCLSDMLEVAESRFSELGRAIGIAGKNDAEIAAGFIDKVKAVCKMCEVPTLQGYGIDEERFMASIEKMATDAIASGSPANAPKAYTAQDLCRLYVACYK